MGQTAKYGTGPNDAHQPEAIICAGPHHKGQKAAPIHTAKARDLHQMCCLKSSSTKLCLLIFVRKYLSAKLHPHFFVPKIFFHKYSSTKFHPEIEIRGTLCAKLCVTKSNTVSREPTKNHCIQKVDIFSLPKSRP